jgi:hypothetical protein
MHTIRRLQASDLSGVVALMRAHLPPPVHEERFLAASLLDGPGADPELPSLVALDDDGVVVGFIAGPVRRLVFDGRPLRAVCCSHLVVAEHARGGALGVKLLRQLRSGAQDLTFTDSANDAVVRVWRTLGGRLDHSRSMDWMLVLRPGAMARTIGAAALTRKSIRPLVPVAALPAQAAGRRVVPRAFPDTDPGVDSVAADVDAILEAEAVLTQVQLRGDHDAVYLRQAFDYLGERGRLVKRVVRRDGHAVGWYAYLVGDGRLARAVHVGADERRIEAVVGELVEHARDDGCVALSGRLDPHLEAPLRRRAAAVGFARRAVVHSKDAEILAALASASSLVTQLDGEWHLI